MSKSLHKDNTFDIYARKNTMIIDRYYPYVYSYDDKKDIDIINDNNEHNILYYNYKNKDNDEINYDLINGNIELYFEDVKNDNIKLSIVNGKIIIKYDKTTKNKEIYYNTDEFYDVIHIIQLGKLKNNKFIVDNIDNNLLLDLNELELCLKNGKISDVLKNKGFNIDIFNEMYNKYIENNNNFDIIKEYYGYSFLLTNINFHNINPYYYSKNLMLFINLRGEIYINSMHSDIYILDDILFDNSYNKQEGNNIYKNYFIIPFNELIYNKYSDLKYINFDMYEYP